MNYRTIRVRYQEPVCYLQFYRPEDNNSINELMIEECTHVMSRCEDSISVVVLEGLPDYFCFGADFQAIHGKFAGGQPIEHDPEPLYDLWLKLATGPYITISHVRGKANAGGIGFVSASDIVLADETAQFSLSELLFGLYPACVLPFLIRRTGFQKAHYMSLMTQPISVQEAYRWGLVDAYDARSDSLLRKHLLRLRRLPKTGIAKYKQFLGELQDSILKFKSLAVAGNREAFLDPANLKRIYHFVETGSLLADKDA